jgi:basic membrane protein A
LRFVALSPYTGARDGNANIPREVPEMSRKRSIPILLVVLAGLLTASLPEPAGAAMEKVKAAWVYVGPVGDAGWTFGHDLGRRSVEKTFPWLETAYIESVSEADAERVIEAFAQKGFNVVFTTSFGYMDPTLNVAKRHPKTIFMHCSGFKRAANVGTYFGRMEQAKFLAGIAAGKLTRSNIIGYVAPVQIPEVIRFIDAFTLGVRKVNPKAVVKVVWTGDWFLPAVEKEAANSLMDAGADVIQTGCDSSAPLQAAEARKTWAVGYDSDARQYAPDRWLTAPIWDWSVLYREILQKVKDGQWTNKDYWWDMSSGLVLLASWGSKVPEEVKKSVGEWQARIVKDRYEIFTGPIKDQSGALKVAEGSAIKDREALEIMWFVEGVQGNITKK